MCIHNWLMICDLDSIKSINKRLFYFWNLWERKNNYFDNTLLVLSSTSGGVYITLFATVIDATVGITSASLNLVFLLVTELQKKI